jgi:single-stranded DNA-specific DHH superfamily exonuclease
MLTEKEIKQIRDELDNCKRPFFLFHDDPDGLCSFLLLYRRVREGKGLVVKTSPRLSDIFVKKIEEYQPDKVFILDIPIISQEFIDKIKVPIIWIDHHDPVDRDKVKYYNGRKKNPKEYIPVSYWCYKVAEEQDMWISMTGCVGDAHVPDFHKQFSKEYPDLLPEGTTEMPDITIKTKLGTLVKVFTFVLKGKTSDIQSCVKILTRIDDPYEILNRKSSRGKFVYKHFYKINMQYQELLQDALSKESEDKILVYIYPENKISLTAILANELTYILKDKFIIVGRKRGDEYRLSMRYNKKIPPILAKALQGIQGYGGGHEYACGASIKEQDFERFIQNIKENI